MTALTGTLGGFAAITAQMQDVERAAATIPDEELMRRTAAGDRDAFAALYRRHGGSVYRFARLMSGSDTVAEDVVQETFIALMHAASRWSSGRSTLTTYLFGIARNLTRRRLLRERRFVTLDASAAVVASESADAPTELERAEELRRLRAAILSLPSRYREVVILCDLHGFGYEAAAATVGCALGTIRSRLHRARHLLADKLRRGAGHARQLRCAV